MQKIDILRPASCSTHQEKRFDSQKLLTSELPTSQKVNDDHVKNSRASEKKSWKPEELELRGSEVETSEGMRTYKRRRRRRGFLRIFGLKNRPHHHFISSYGLDGSNPRLGMLRTILRFWPFCWLGLGWKGVSYWLEVAAAIVVVEGALAAFSHFHHFPLYFYSYPGRRMSTRS